MSGFILDLGEKRQFAFEGRCTRDPVAFGQHSDDFRMRMLPDLTDQCLAVGIRHPIPRFNADVVVDFFLKFLFEFDDTHFVMPFMMIDMICSVSCCSLSFVFRMPLRCNHRKEDRIIWKTRYGSVGFRRPSSIPCRIIRR